MEYLYKAVLALVTSIDPRLFDSQHFTSSFGGLSFIKKALKFSLQLCHKLGEMKEVLKENEAVCGRIAVHFYVVKIEVIARKKIKFY